ncbi:hypothetical protein Ahy_A09g042802 isoform D [Arachis hypogaea]|uniref:Uncharacterized protein n=1 Tax=Arachis hypogaea TaxID=3818 RepID=A0A445BGW2_ARAHY|nr:hypothetical protein Ahy_A09g042802 isoform D [Arachis hypogaea]
MTLVIFIENEEESFIMMNERFGNVMRVLTRFDDASSSSDSPRLVRIPGEFSSGQAKAKPFVERVSSCGCVLLGEGLRF